MLVVGVVFHHAFLAKDPKGLTKEGAEGRQTDFGMQQHLSV